MSCVVGIDLGSTTTKAVVLDETGEVLGPRHHELALELRPRGRASRGRRRSSARGSRCSSAKWRRPAGPETLARLLRAFRLEQMLHPARGASRADRGGDGRSAPRRARRARRCASRGRSVAEIAGRGGGSVPGPAPPGALRLLPRRGRIGVHCASPRQAAQAPGAGVTFDRLVGLYDKCIIRVENEPLELDFRDHIGEALRRGRASRRACARRSTRPDAADLDVVRHGRHRLRPGAAALPQGADPLRDPVPRPRRARALPRHAHRARHRRAGHQGDPGRRAAASSRASR